MTVAANPRPAEDSDAPSAALGFAQVVVKRVRRLPETIGAWFSGFGEPEAEIATNRGDAPSGMRIALYQNDSVRKIMRAYTEVRRNAFLLGLRRAEVYIPMIRRVFAEEGLPQELAYLAVVESNLDPLARSPKWALGLWQFMPHTARRFGLHVSPWYDERLDPLLSTRAAARFLNYLHNRFGNWELALAAYNAGEGRVNQAIRYNRMQGVAEDFWHLQLPMQTRRYVPAFLAIASLYTDLEGHGFDPLQPAPWVALETVWGLFHATLGEIAQRIGLSGPELAALNPAWKQGAIPRVQEGEVMLRLPEGRQVLLFATMAERPFRPPTVLTHRVMAGETLSHISRQYGVHLRELMMANEIRNRHFLRRGQELIIPLTGQGRGRTRKI